MLGYWEDPERTAEVIDAARWMHTGDLATMDEEGYVGDRGPRQGHGHPRRRERLSARGRRIPDSPRRDQGRRGSWGVPDERYGEELAAWVIVRDGATVSDDELRDYCQGKIAHYKIPRYITLRR